jgi:hypothetical protein
MDRDHGGDEQRRWARRYSRPYVVTGGRTQSASHADLEIEALASLTPEGRSALPMLSDEWGAIAELCSDSFCSVAELSAYLQVPIGVVRVLVGDLVTEGILAVHRPAGSKFGQRPDRDLLERVLEGLRRLPT